MHMDVYIKRSINWLLILTMLVCSQPVALWAEQQSTSAAALLTAVGEKNFSNVEDYHERVESLRDAFFGVANQDHPLDTFHLLTQTVVDKRKEEIAARKQQVQAADFEERRRREVEFLVDELEKDFERGKSFIGQERLSDAAEILGIELNFGDLESVSSLVEAALSNDQVAEALDIRPEKLQDFVDEDLPPRREYRMNLTVEVNDTETAEQGSITTVRDKMFLQLKQSNFLGSASINFNSKDLYVDHGDNQRHFDLATKKGQPLHRFHRAVDAVGFYGPYLVYIESGSYNTETETLPLRFIDLEYFRGDIGNAPLPVFTIPLKTDGPVHSFEIQSGELVVNGTRLNMKAFRFLADFFTVFFNLSVSLVDSRTHENAEQLINQITRYFDLSMGKTDDYVKGMLDEAVGNQNVQAFPQEALKILNGRSKITDTNSLERIREEALEAQASLKDDPSIRSIQDEVLNQKHLQASNQAVMVSRRFMSRMHMFMAYLTHPKPRGSATLLQSLAMVATGLKSKDKKLRKEGYRELMAHPLARFTKYGAGVTAAASLGSALPEPYTFHLYQSLDLANAMMEHALGYLRHIDYGANYVRLIGEAARAEVSGLSPVNLYNSYVAEGRAPKLAVLLAVSVSLPFLVFAVPHLLSNGLRAAKSLRNNRTRVGYYMKRHGMNRWEALRETFIDWRNREKLIYDRLQSESESRISGGEKNFNAAQTSVLKDVLEKQGMKKENKKELGLVRRALRCCTRRSQELLARSFRFAQKVENELEGQALALEDQAETAVKLENSVKKTRFRNIDSFGKAIGHFMLSFPSLVFTRKCLGTAWNYCFLSRSFWRYPKTWYMAMVYPKYFRTTISSHKDRIHAPTKLNGGLRPVWTHWNLKIKALFGNDSLERLTRVENAVLPAEGVAYEFALRTATNALIKYTDDPNTLLNFFDSADKPANSRLPNDAVMKGAVAPTSGVSSISDNKLRSLTKKQRIFFRAYFQTALTAAMEKYLAEVVGDSSSQTFAEGQSQSFKELKSEMTKRFEELLEHPNLKHSQAMRNRIKAIMTDPQFQEEVYKTATHITEDLGQWAKRQQLKLHHDLAQVLDPHDSQMSRFMTAERKLQDQKALLRATRAENAALFVDKPLSIAAILLLYAGVQDGSIMQPLHDEMFGPNSWFYGSRLHFLQGFVLGTVLSIMADTWMKVQEDQRIDDLGGFDKVPTAKDMDKGFWRYYFKNLFKNPSNKWAANQWNYTQLVWANMPAAFITIAVFNGLALGRFDLGMFLAGYMIIYLTPIMGMRLKFEQAFELATSWIGAKIPRRLRSHAEALNAVNVKAQLQRIRFNLGAGVMGVALEPIQSLFEIMNTEQFGKRSFLNLTFFGWQPEELVSQALQGVVKATNWIPYAGPAVEHVATMCESILTNNNTALDPSRLMTNPVED